METEKELRKQEREQERVLLETLEELGGKIVRDDDVTYEGTRFIIPEGMSAKAALEFLERHVEMQEEVTAFHRSFPFRPWDGANAFASALKKITGTSGIARATFSFFGKNPPEMVTINIGPHKSAQVPWGMVEVPLFKGRCYLRGEHELVHGLVFKLTVEAPRKYRHAVEGLFKAVGEELKTNSIYRGQAIDASTDPTFKDTDLIDPEKLVFSQQALADLGAQLWWPIEDIDGVKKHDMRIKRAILLEGSYGTGKTETANITAKKCVKHGWTFIQVRANQDDIASAMQTAKLYQPAVVFFEDVDIIADSEKSTPGSMSQLLDLFDGMDAKHTDIIAVLTTNHVDKIHKGMLRPGRLDGIIHLSGLDRPAVERLAHIQLGEHAVEDVDFDQVFDAMQGYMPAFVSRAFAKAVEYSRGADNYTTEDLVHAAEGLRPQFELYTEANENKTGMSFEEFIMPAVRDAIHDANLIDVDDGELMYQIKSKQS